MITDLRKDAVSYTFDQEKGAKENLLFEKFLIETRDFLKTPEKLCREELEVIDSISLFQNYVKAKDDLKNLYTPLDGEKVTDYLSRIRKSDMSTIEAKYNSTHKFTLLDISKQENSFRNFYKEKQNGKFEQLFLDFINYPLRIAAQCYLLAKKTENLPSVFIAAFSGGACAADKVERLTKWLSRAENGSFPKLNKELEGDGSVNYEEKLKGLHTDKQSFVQKLIDFLLTNDKDKPAQRYKNRLEDTKVLESELKDIQNFFFNNAKAYIRENEIKIGKKEKRAKKLIFKKNQAIDKKKGREKKKGTQENKDEEIIILEKELRDIVNVYILQIFPAQI